MTSTRDKNSNGNYCLEQRSLENIRNNLAYYNGPNGHAVNPALPESYLGGRMPSDNLAYNPTDIESVLFGIGSIVVGHWVWTLMMFLQRMSTN